MTEYTDVNTTYSHENIDRMYKDNDCLIAYKKRGTWATLLT